jgi:alkylhydroperoxidase family enzyme
MQYLSISGFPIVEPEDAPPEVADLYDKVKQEIDQPTVPNWAKVAANSPGSLDIYLNMLRAFNRNISLPQTIVPIILYSIATARNCTYCSTINELSCRTLGVDEKTLELLANDLDNVSPQRLRVIIQFALKCALDPQGLTAPDYERVREQGINDDELTQIIFLAALANFNDALADSLKIDPEPGVMEALGR